MTNRTTQRHDRVAAGLCAFCAKPRNRWRFLCDDCNEIHRERQRKRKGSRGTNRKVTMPARSMDLERRRLGIDVSPRPESSRGAL